MENKTNELKTPSKLQVGDEAYIYICADEERRMMPLSVNWLFLPCKITAVRFTPSKVYYDVALSIQLPGEGDESKNIRLHGVDSALLFTVDEYCNRVKNDFGHAGKEKVEYDPRTLKGKSLQPSNFEEKIDKPLIKLSYLLTEFLNSTSDIKIASQETLEKRWELFVEGINIIY